MRVVASVALRFKLRLERGEGSEAMNKKRHFKSKREAHHALAIHYRYCREM